jgi:hypothetical protein
MSARIAAFIAAACPSKFSMRSSNPSLFMGASFRLRFGGEKLNRNHLDAPTFSSPVSSSSQAFSAPGVSSAVGLVGAEFALRHSSHQTGAVFFVPVSFHSS